MIKFEQEIINDLLGASWRRKWIIVGFFILTNFFVVMTTKFQEPMYRAVSKVIVESPSNMNIEDVQTMMPVSNMASSLGLALYLDLQKSVIYSFNIAEKVCNEVKLKQVFKERGEKGIGKSVFTKYLELFRVKGFYDSFQNTLKSVVSLKEQEEETTDEELKEQIRQLLEKIRNESLVSNLHSKMTIAVKNSQVFHITVQDIDNFLAVSIADKMAEIYCEENLKHLQSAAMEANEWLKKELDQTKEELTLLEQGVRDFKEKNNVLSAEVMEENLAMRSNALIALKQKVDVKKELLTTYESRYGPKHPKMILVKKELEHLEKELMMKRYLDMRAETLSFEYSLLMAKLDNVKTLYGSLLDRLKETALMVKLTPNNIRILEKAKIPTAPFKPNKIMNLLAGIILGFLGGIGIVAFLEFLDQRIRSVNVLVKEMSIPALGQVGFIPKQYLDDSLYISKVCTRYSEEYRRIQSNICFMDQRGSSQKFFTFASYKAGEGKSTTVANLAQVMAEGGSRILIVNADLRKPTSNNMFNNERSIPGFADFLEGNADFEAIINETNVHNLHVTYSGNAIAKPAKLLNSQKMWDFINTASKNFDRIFFDTPAIGLVNDAVTLGCITKCVVLIVEHDRSKRSEVKFTQKTFGDVGIRIFGAVFNKCGDSKFVSEKEYISMISPDKSGNDNT